MVEKIRFLPAMDESELDFTPVSRSVYRGGGRVCIRLEGIFWRHLDLIAYKRNLLPQDLHHQLYKDAKRIGVKNVASYMRCWVLKHLGHK